MNAEIASLTEDEIIKRLSYGAGENPDSPYPPGLLSTTLRPAAVLIPFLLVEHAWHILYIHRTANDSDPHSSQVAFPGGGAHPEDTDVQMTALREAHEEVGIQPTDVRILGHLKEYITITSYRVTPVVGVIDWPYPLKLDYKEVSRAFTIPLEWLANPKNYEERKRSLPSPFPPIPVIYYQPYLGEVLWGASARITRGLIQLLCES